MMCACVRTPVCVYLCVWIPLCVCMCRVTDAIEEDDVSEVTTPHSHTDRAHIHTL